MLSLALLSVLFGSRIPTNAAPEETVFVEAEDFRPTSDGWRVAGNRQTRAASATKTLHGATGDSSGSAFKTVTIAEGGRYRIHVRYLHHRRWRGPFVLTIRQDRQTVATKVIDSRKRQSAGDFEYVWESFDVNLHAGEVDLQLSKFRQKNCTSYSRHVDCLLLTTDLQLTPSHIPYGPQTYLRATVAKIYEHPVYIHVFADHYRAPWYQHFHLSKAGALRGLQPSAGSKLKGGEQTPWCNITPMLYQDSGAILNITVRYTYHRRADRLKLKLEFATAAEEAAIVRTMIVDSKPNGLVIVAPPDLTTDEHRRRLKRDRDFAEQTGRIADSYNWPKIGRKPHRFPFFVAARVGGYGTPVDQSVQDREWKTLDYFGFCNRTKTHIGGLWYVKGRSYCRPDIERMKTVAAARAAEFHSSGQSTDDIVYCMLMDEPTGQTSSWMAEDPAYHAAFRSWLRNMGRSPSELLVENWDAVRPIPQDRRDEFPALHYFTQRFRTRALGDLLAVQREILEKAYGRSLPTVVNFSDGATYAANFYAQGVDYFELLDDDRQNAIWGEDWANGSSSYQCAAYNVDLMRAASRERGQTIGHYLIAHAGRKPWDIKLKAASETARGVRIWRNFSYGVGWGSHEGGPAWRTHLWYAKPETWRANAEIVREIGAVENLLLEATARPAKVAILYSSSSDIWTLRRNHAFGFERMHTWMALAHAQIPVDFISERQVERGGLASYRVCYLFGPNLTRAAAVKLRQWVQDGGALVLSAGAATRDEFNHPLEALEAIVPADRRPLETLQPFLNSGAYLYILRPKDAVTAGRTTLDVLSVRQQQNPRPGSEVTARFSDGSAAIVRGRVARGVVYSVGFLPALHYIRQAIVARRAAAELQEAPHDPVADRDSSPTPPVDVGERSGKQKPPAEDRLQRSYNPWEFSADVRELVLAPVRRAGVEPPLQCSVPLIDAVLLDGPQSSVIPLANYTLAPLKRVEFRLTATRPIERIESVHQGAIEFRTKGNTVRFSLPLGATDYVSIHYGR